MRVYLLLSVISIICLGLQFEPLSSYVEWNAAAIHSGQWWRILTGNFTHTNFAHWAMNLIGLWFIGFIFKPNLRTLLLPLLLTSMAVGIGNLFTDMQIYVGLSGSLHGLFGYYALRESLHGRKSSGLLVFGLMAKIVWEFSFGASTMTSDLIDARVAIESHLFGAVSGLSLAYFSHWYGRKQNA
ncbi:rhombosortase [Vibrio genomosp. F10]|uniref:rhombosortase n=1 Tax=Vibrio genomosp. F10 TaxID=723171 RepID=UPI0002F5547C|nr:rhombosortase [Vibrio genomosp. F10]OEF04019.1 rhombosortase [Vibrio genomosp. F10 str. 9ZB36]